MTHTHTQYHQCRLSGSLSTRFDKEQINRSASALAQAVTGDIMQALEGMNSHRQNGSTLSNEEYSEGLIRAAQSLQQHVRHSQDRLHMIGLLPLAIAKHDLTPQQYDAAVEGGLLVEPSTAHYAIQLSYWVWLIEHQLECAACVLIMTTATPLASLTTVYLNIIDRGVLVLRRLREGRGVVSEILYCDRKLWSLHLQTFTPKHHGRVARRHARSLCYARCCGGGGFGGQT
jgi:hypothetical protein